jgi:glyoxylase-like metal-dependent hydrolase (beta-lactamase superfamily II)
MNQSTKQRVYATCWFLALAAVACEPCQATAPMMKTQAGFYRMMLGDFEVTALNDGTVAYQTKRLLPTATAEQIKTGLAESSLTDPVALSYNAFLINTGSKLVLIDTGTGGKLEDQPEFHGAGHLMANLHAAGYRPEQVDEIYITHRGQDHIGGLTIGQERAFPNAMVRAPKAEFDLFLDPAKTAALLAEAHNDEKVRAWVQFTQDLFEPYIKAGRFESFDADITLVPGIRALATHGHTPGHTSYIVESKGQTLIVMGDLVIMGALQFADPSLGSSADADPKAAAQQRLRVFKLAADNDYWVAGGHLSFPGIGHIRAAQDRFFWIPANYTIPRTR